MKPSDCIRAYLSDYLERTHTTQIKFSERIGIAASKLNGFLKGNINFSETKLAGIAKEINVDLMKMVMEGYHIAQNGEDAIDFSLGKQVDLKTINVDEFRKLRAGTSAKSQGLLWALFKSIDEDQRRIIMNTMMGMFYDGHE
ncbi:MAG: helix-turn-helix transcriptional regulator [Desulfobacteraceae bacterium]|nr:helix-turn-helix transcriptional regulator [Desulfobacteraceae bacterium]